MKKVVLRLGKWTVVQGRTFFMSKVRPWMWSSSDYRVLLQDFCGYIQRSCSGALLPACCSWRPGFQGAQGSLLWLSSFHLLYLVPSKYTFPSSQSTLRSFERHTQPCLLAIDQKDTVIKWNLLEWMAGHIVMQWGEQPWSFADSASGLCGAGGLPDMPI